MILVVNLNASLDKRYEMGELVKGAVMRARAVENTPGGKGLHVANVATILGENCVATGFLGGKTGELIAQQTAAYGIRGDFVTIAGETRSCLAIITDDGVQTEILEPGPEISADELRLFIDKYEELLDQASCVVLSGSVPRQVPEDFYADLITRAREKGKKVFLDTSGARLAAGIAAKPYFIKPNRDEIEALTGRKISSLADAAREARLFLEQGISLAAISLGGQGSIIAFDGCVYRAVLPRVEAVNPVGSGDAYVAGMAAAAERGLPIEAAIQLASACGTANAMEKESGFVQKGVVEKLTQQIKVAFFQG